MLAQGSPQNPTAAQIAELEEASRPAEIITGPELLETNGGTKLTPRLPRQAVSLIFIE